MNYCHNPAANNYFGFPWIETVAGLQLCNLLLLTCCSNYWVCFLPCENKLFRVPLLYSCTVAPSWYKHIMMNSCIDTSKNMVMFIRMGIRIFIYTVQDVGIYWYLILPTSCSISSISWWFPAERWGVQGPTSHCGMFTCTLTSKRSACDTPGECEPSGGRRSRD